MDRLSGGSSSMLRGAQGTEPSTVRLLTGLFTSLVSPEEEEEEAGDVLGGLCCCCKRLRRRMILISSQEGIACSGCSGK